MSDKQRVTQDLRQGTINQLKMLKKYLGGGNMTYDEILEYVIGCSSDQVVRYQSTFNKHQASILPTADAPPPPRLKVKSASDHVIREGVIRFLPDYFGKQILHQTITDRFIKEYGFEVSPAALNMWLTDFGCVRELGLGSDAKARVAWTAPRKQEFLDLV